MPDLTRASLELLIKISRELASTLDLHQVLNKVVRLSTEALGAERCVLIAINQDKKPAAVASISQGEMVEISPAGIESILDRGLAGWVMRNRQEVLIHNTNEDPRWLIRPDDLSENTGSKSALCIPVNARDELVGVMTIVHPEVNFFTIEHLDLLKSIAAQAGMYIHNALLFDSLQAANQRYRELFDDSLLPMMITDWDGRILEYNRQAIQICPTEMKPLEGKSLLRFIHADDEKLSSGFETLQNGESISLEAEVQWADEISTPVEVHVRAVKVTGRLLLQWILVDRTERRTLDSLRDDLIAMIYHDLRSPLANIISSLDMLAALVPVEYTPSVKSVFSIATRSTNRMQRLISSLLDIHQLEAGRLAVQREPVDVRELVRDAVEAVEPVVESKTQAILQQIPEDLPRISGDADMLRRVLINLAENATKFTPPNGHIILGAEKDENWVKLWVDDSGPGIPAEHHDSVFEKFTRLQPERFPKGLGLGLAFCKMAVQAHGGRIWVESIEGHGSRFVLTLPCESNCSGV